MEHELRETVAVSADRQIAMAPDSPPAWAADGSPPAPDCFAPVFGAKQFFSAIPCSVTAVIRAPPRVLSWLYRRMRSDAKQRLLAITSSRASEGTQR